MIPSENSPIVDIEKEPYNFIERNLKQRIAEGARFPTSEEAQALIALDKANIDLDKANRKIEMLEIDLKIVKEERAKIKAELRAAFSAISSALDHGADEEIWPSGTYWYDAAAKIINDNK